MADPKDGTYNGMELFPGGGIAEMIAEKWSVDLVKPVGKSKEVEMTSALLRLVAFFLSFNLALFPRITLLKLGKSSPGRPVICQPRGC